MQREDRIVAIPWVGQYTYVFKELFESLGLKVQLPPKTTDKTVKIGAKYSPDMVCIPYKITLGNFIEALEEGANTLITLNGEPHCRFRHFYLVQEFALKRLGYKDFEMYGINVANGIPLLKKLSGYSVRRIWRHVGELRENSWKVDQEKSKWSSERLNIGIIGEPYVCWDERANYGIEQKIVELGANPVNTVGFGDFLRERADEKFEHIPFVHFTRPEKRPFRVQAQTYFNGAVGGYALANMYNLLWLSDKKVDGLIHLLPLSCAFESMIEEYINAICRDAEIPLLRIAIDENYSESNFDTRMETFIKLIQRRKAR